MTKAPCYLANFHHIRPHFEIDQRTILEWLARTHTEAEALVSKWNSTSVEKKRFHQNILERLKKIGLGKGKIQYRGIHFPDIFEEKWDQRAIFNLFHHPRGRGLGERSLFFSEHIEKIFDRFYSDITRLPNHLIHVTCTGYIAPSPAQKLVAKKGQGNSTTVTHAYHMGCYGAFPAIRIARGFIQAPSTEQVDIVHTELCSIHMNPLFHSADQLVVQSLFGDGFIKYSLFPKVCKEKNSPCLQLLSLHEEIIADSAHMMSWYPNDWGMQMTLSQEIPSAIAKNIASFLKHLCLPLPSTPEPLFAIHPGGPKIIHQLLKLLGLSEKQIKHSQNILSKMGNMSSSTLPHIWESMLNDSEVSCGQRIISLAFGPGLSISGAVFEKIQNAKSSS